MNGEEKKVTINEKFSMHDGKWHHIVLTWSSRGRAEWKLHIDGTRYEAGSNLSTKKPVPGQITILENTYFTSQQNKETLYTNRTNILMK